MARWFVYIDTNYYPYGEFVDADTPAEANALVRRLADRRDHASLVFPADAEAGRYFTPASEWRFEALEHEAEL